MRGILSQGAGKERMIFARMDEYQGTFTGAFFCVDTRVREGNPVRQVTVIFPSCVSENRRDRQPFIQGIRRSTVFHISTGFPGAESLINSTLVTNYRVTDTMKKSDIVISVVKARSQGEKSDNEIVRDLSRVLERRSLKVETWDQPVNTPIGNSIIMRAISLRGEVHLDYLVRDIDMILNRIT